MPAPGQSYDPGVSDFSTRPATLEDASALNDLLAAAETVDQTGEHYSVEDVVEELENPMIDLERDWLVVERDGQVVGHCGLLPRAPADGTGQGLRRRRRAPRRTAGPGSARTSSR